MNRIKKVLTSLCYLLLISWTSNAQSEEYSLARLEKQLDSLIWARMESEHIPGVGFIIIKDGKVLLKKGYGYASLAPIRQKLDPDSTIFRIGSISKTFTATALLQLVDRKQLDLHKDVNTYLTSIKVPDTFKDHVTPAHLINHSAGFDEIGGRVVFAKNEMVPLASFLKNRLIRVRPSGIVPAYSTYGIALAGLLIEDLSNQSLESYFKKNIWGPLGMNMTSIEVPDSLKSYVALGYEYEDGKNKAQPWEWYHTYPASSINGTLADMSKYMQMHLNYGTLNNNIILSKKLASEMQKKQISLQPKLSGFGYGLYENEWHGIKTFDHGGDMLGFSSQMVLAHEKDMGIFVIHHHEGTKLRRDVVSTIVKHFYPAVEKSLPQNNPKLKAGASMFAGEYRWISNCTTCPGSDKQQTWQIKANEDGTLSGFDRRFVQVEPLLFKSEDGERTMGFQKNKEGTIQYMSMGNINVFEKTKSK